MVVEEEILQRVRALTPEQQAKVREYADQLLNQPGDRTPLKSLEGLWSSHSFDLTDEDIEKARRELWSAFPRDVNP